MSYYDEADDPLNRMIDEYGRHRLTDVQEEDYEEEQYIPPPSNGWINRKRFSSNSSAILTEDTDSFIIGDRVWVGGSKPGHIAFIGETQFAPGEWAGIALDEAIGKNDGSVSGIRYFMCEPKKGVFSRLTRLTRAPIHQDIGGSGDTFSSQHHTPLNGSVRKSPLSPSPTESHRSIMKSPVSISGSNTSLSSAHVDYKLGDRVIIKSGQGSKVGTVRFMGVTEFAPGEWVGVELDEPRGKNDGSVNGIRYFECQPNFGLFSPVSKVSKSPSKIKPSQCQIHSPTGTGRLPPSGLRRTNSKESMTSNVSMLSSASTAARRRVSTKPATTPVPTRTALQDVLKEKQQHIEQLLKERDLERAEITRAASQADEAESKYVLLSQEFAKYRAECEIQLQEHIKLLNELKESRNELLAQLEDERKKNEDWQFKFEEAEITRADLEVSNQTNISKVKELEEALKSEKERVENLESEVNKLFETEESLIKTKEEVENLKKELHEARTKHVALEGDTATTTVLIKSLQDDLDQNRKDCDEKSEMITVLKNEISSIQQEQESLKKQIELREVKINEAEEKVENKSKEIDNVKLEMEELNKVMGERNKTIENLQAENLNIENTLQKELDKLKMELSSKIVDFEGVTDKLRNAESSIENFKVQLENANAAAEAKNQELLQYQSNLGDLDARLTKERDALQESLKQKTAETDNLRKELSDAVSQKNKDIEEVRKDVKEKSDRIEKLLGELGQQKEGFEKMINELVEKQKKELGERDKSISQRSMEISQKEEEVAKLNNKISELESSLNENTVKLEKVTLEVQASQDVNKNDVDVIKKLNEDINNLNSVKVDLERKNKEFEELKAILENNNKKFEADLSAKADELNKAIETVNTKDRKLNEANLELERSKENSEKLSQEIIQFQNKLSDVETTLKTERDNIKQELEAKVNELKNISEESLKLKEELKNKTVEAENLSQNLKATNDMLELKNTLGDLESKLKQDLEQLQAELQNQIRLKKDVEHDLNGKLNKKDEELKQMSTANEETSKILADLNKSIDEVRVEAKEKSEHLEKLKSELVQQKEGFEKMMSELIDRQKQELGERDESILKSSAEISKRDEEASQLTCKITELESTLNGHNAELEKIRLELQEAQKVNNNGVDVIKKLTQEVDDLTVGKSDLENKLKELDELKANLESDKKQFELDLKSKSDELITVMETVSIKDAKLKEITEELEKSKQNSEKLSQEIVQYQNNLSNVEDNLRKERDTIKEEFDAKVSEFKNLSVELSKLKEDLQNKTTEAENIAQNKETIEKQLESRDVELQKVKEELLQLKNNLEGKVSEESALKQQFDEVKTELSSRNTELQAVKNELSKVVKDLEEKLNEANNALAESTKKIHEKEDEIIDITEKQKIFIKELMEDHKLKISENNNKNQDLDKVIQNKVEEINKLNVNVEELKKTLTNREGEVEKLNKELMQINSTNTEMSSKVSESSKAIEDLEKENKEYKHKLEKLETQLYELKNAKDALDLQVKQTTSDTSSQVNELERKLQLKEEMIKSMKVETEKLEAENVKVINEQSEKLKAMEYSEGLLKNMVAEMEKDAKEASILKTNVSNLHAEVSKRDVTIASKDSEIAKLREQLAKNQNNANVNGTPSDSVVKASNSPPDYKQLLEEKIFAENQVAFLNSIIVDMQKKNEEQKAKIEILEMGYSPAAAEELNQLGFKTDYERHATPRTYCDICEEFDLHETEDCPTQASEEPASNAQLGRDKKEKPPPRPYCEICGEFGHETEDCTDDQEF